MYYFMTNNIYIIDIKTSLYKSILYIIDINHVITSNLSKNVQAFFNLSYGNDWVILLH